MDLSSDRNLLRATSDSHAQRSAFQRRPCSPLQVGGSLSSTMQPTSERARELEENARRLRQQSMRVRAENRRARTFPTQASEDATRNSMETNVELEANGYPTQRLDEQRRFEDMRKRIAELDEINEQERIRLEQEEQEAERRRVAQEEFEREVEERTARELREHQQREEREQMERLIKEAEHQREQDERERKRRAREQEQEDEQRKREEAKLHARSEKEQMKWDRIERELDSAWAEQEAAEKRRLEEYAAARRRQFEEMDRRLNAERQRYVHEADYCKARGKMFGAKREAAADEAFYSSQRQNFGKRGPGFAMPGAAGPKPPPSFKPVEKPVVDTKGLCSEELDVLKSLQAMRSASRDAQKAKVKELLFKWHPDKNPDSAEKATKIFQFVQKHKEVILGL